MVYELLNRFQTTTIFLIGMDVGIKEEAENPTSFIFQYLERIDGAGRTAHVQQYFQDVSYWSKICIHYNSSFAPLWIPACAGMTWKSNLLSFLRKQESRKPLPFVNHSKMRPENMVTVC
jgi:hypothetical protein